MFLLILSGADAIRGVIYFNTSHVSINPFVPLPSFMCFSNFNTSHVSINHSILLLLCAFYLHFNTSHVSINLAFASSSIMPSNYFNTSHVSINRSPQVTICRYGLPISIHLMFLLIRVRRDGQPLLAGQFRYISCFY